MSLTSAESDPEIFRFDRRYAPCPALHPYLRRLSTFLRPLT